MEFTTQIDALKKALGRVHFFISEPQNKYPYGNLEAALDSIVVAGTNGAVYLETAVPAQVSGEGSCQVGELFERVLKNMPGDSISCRLTERNIMMSNDRGLKARAQIVAGDFPPSAMAHSKIDSLNFVYNAVVFRSELMAIINVSEMLPPTPGKMIPWVFLTIKDSKISGATQESELGAIEEMPLNTLSFSGEGNAVTFRANTTYFKTLVSLCGDQVHLRMTDDLKAPILISDPLDDSWWGFLVGIA